MTFNFEDYIASERFAPYRSFSSSLESQRALYLWNCELSLEMSKAIGHAEIFLRESIDQQLRRWNRLQPAINGSTHNQAGQPLHHSDPRRRAAGGSEEWLKHPSQKLANLLLSKRGNRIVSEYDSAYTRRLIQKSNPPTRQRPHHTAT